MNKLILSTLERNIKLSSMVTARCHYAGAPGNGLFLSAISN
jgi:hypothetical protein